MSSRDLNFRFRLSHILTLFIILVGVLPLSLVGLLGHTTIETMSKDISLRNYTLAQTLATTVDGLLLHSRDIMLETRSHLGGCGFIDEDEINGYLASPHKSSSGILQHDHGLGQVGQGGPFGAVLLPICWGWTGPNTPR